jgi:plastocyanin
MKGRKSVLFQRAAIVGLAGALYAAQAATVTVKIVGYSFNPSNTIVNVGDTVVWSGLENMHNVTGLIPQDLDDFCGGGPSDLDTETSCSHTFTAAGTFPYECTIHGPCCGMTGNIIVVAAAAPTPTVSITNPAGGAVFAAPASISIAADATVSSGTVTNVQFFANGNSLGSAPAAPFALTSSNLSAGSYALTAVATAAGISATSAVVSITVISQPTVAIVSPAAGAVLAAPANINIVANASVSGGAVTNVQFFTNGISLGTALVSPFSVAANNLAAGAYALTAVATAAGVSTTSAVVSVSVVSPVAVTLSALGVAGGQFSFNYNASVSLAYSVQSSVDLVNWSPVSTNVASSATGQFTDTAPVTGSRFYRVVLQPNP